MNKNNNCHTGLIIVGNMCYKAFCYLVLGVKYKLKQLPLIILIVGILQEN